MSGDIIRCKADMIPVLLGGQGRVLVIVPGRCLKTRQVGLEAEVEKGGGPLVECSMGLALGGGVEGCSGQRQQLGT